MLGNFRNTTAADSGSIGGVSGITHVSECDDMLTNLLQVRSLCKYTTKFALDKLRSTLANRVIWFKRCPKYIQQLSNGLAPVR
jgi:hypothetical protein